MLTTLATCLVLAATTGNPPNVLIILMDDVGRDKVGAYADHPNPAPTQLSQSLYLLHAILV